MYTLIWRVQESSARVTAREVSATVTAQTNT